MNRFNAGLAYYEIGEIRRRLGDLDGAEQAFHDASEYGCDPQPGLALLRLAQGKRDAATTASPAPSPRPRGTTSPAPSCSPRR